MSAAVALVAPERAPRRAAEPRRHLEIVPSRAQRRARPRLVLAVGTMSGIVVILLAQLGLSIAVADGAYTISSLQLQQRDLHRQNEALAEQLESLQSPQFLAINAEALGMVASGSLPYIDLATGAISGKSTKPGGSILHGTGGVPNTTLEGLGIVQPQEQELQLGYTGAITIGSEEHGSEGGQSAGGGLVLDPGIHVVGGPGGGTQQGEPAASVGSSPVSSGTGSTGAGTTTIPSPSVR